MIDSGTIHVLAVEIRREDYRDPAVLVALLLEAVGHLDTETTNGADMACRLEAAADALAGRRLPRPWDRPAGLAATEGKESEVTP